jgi:hypothetical protein
MRCRANPAIALLLQSTRRTGRIAELGSFGDYARTSNSERLRMNLYHYIDDQGNIRDALPLAALHKIGLPPATKVLLEGTKQ